MLRYYPSFKIIPNQSTSGGEFILDGKTYVGRYYITYDGRAYSGPSPQVGPSKLLTRDVEYSYKAFPTNPNISSVIDNKNIESAELHSKIRVAGKPNSYQPIAVESDYKKDI